MPPPPYAESAPNCVQCESALRLANNKKLTYKWPVYIFKLRFCDSQVFSMDDEKVTIFLRHDFDFDAAFEVITVKVGVQVQVVVLSPGVGGNPVVSLPLCRTFFSHQVFE